MKRRKVLRKFFQSTAYLVMLVALLLRCFTSPAEAANGKLSGKAPKLTYMPTVAFAGADFFTFGVNDGSGDSVPATVRVTDNTVNSAPVAYDQITSTEEDSFKDIELWAEDIDGDALSFVIQTQPQHGILSGTAPYLTYTPNSDFNGTDSFSFKAFDGSYDSNIATVDITVNPVNDAPVAYDQITSTEEDSFKDIELWAEDIDGDALSFVIQTQPQHGTLSGTGGNVTYTPAANYFGEDSFTFYANDGTVDSAPATVFISIAAMIDAPTADPQSVSLDEDASTSVTLTGFSESGEIFFFVVKQPTNGTLSGTTPYLTYTPNSDFNGTDSFSFKAFDGWYDSNIATVDIKVVPSLP